MIFYTNKNRKNKGSIKYGILAISTMPTVRIKSVIRNPRYFEVTRMRSLTSRQYFTNNPKTVEEIRMRFFTIHF